MPGFVFRGRVIEENGLRRRDRARSHRSVNHLAETGKAFLDIADGASYTAASFDCRGIRMRHLLLAGLAGLVAIPAANAAQNCSGSLVQPPLPVRATVLEPVASEFTPTVSQLGAPSGVLTQALDEALSVDRVLMRLRIEGCQNVAKAMPAPAAVANANDPSGYKPKTQYDNTPWRFDMNQNGKRMTAEEFDAWMKARGVRVAKGAGGAAAPAPAAPAAPAPETKK